MYVFVLHFMRNKYIKQYKRVRELTLPTPVSGCLCVFDIAQTVVDDLDEIFRLDSIWN